MPDRDDVAKADELVSSDHDLPETLYHYTDINGLAGVWEQGQLWASNSIYLNDTTEIRLGLNVVKSRLMDQEIKLLQQVVDVWERETALNRTAEEVDTDSFDTERAALQPDLTEVREIRAAIETIGDDSDTYIACLTEHGDQLSQWRGYAREGYCVGIDTKMLLASLPDGHAMKRVHYYDEETNDAFAARIIDLAKRHRQMVMSMDQTEVSDDFQEFVIARFSMVEAAFMKDSSFREEGEVRIVEISLQPDGFTRHRYGMVPRKFIDIPAGAIKSVRVGPSAHEELKQRSLRGYFLNTGFAGKPLPPIGERTRPLVLRSAIPFRDW